MCPKSRDLHISQGVTCIINGRILLAKSLQGEKSGSYLGFWLRWTGPEPFFYPNWRYDASRFSRTGSAPSNSPAVSGSLRECETPIPGVLANLQTDEFARMREPSLAALRQEHEPVDHAGL